MLRGDTEQRHPSPPCGKTAWGGFRVSELSCIQKALWRNWRGRNAPQLHVAASETWELCHTLHGGAGRGDSLPDGACRVSSRLSLCPQPHVPMERQTFGGGMKARPRHQKLIILFTRAETLGLVSGLPLGTACCDAQLRGTVPWVLLMAGCFLCAHPLLSLRG